MLGVTLDVTAKRSLYCGHDRELSRQAHDLAVLPGNRFEALKGDRKGQYSIRINDQWRVCFEWPDRSPGPVNVEIIDYHR